MGETPRRGGTAVESEEPYGQPLHGRLRHPSGERVIVMAQTVPTMLNSDNHSDRTTTILAGP